MVVMDIDPQGNCSQPVAAGMTEGALSPAHVSSITDPMGFLHFPWTQLNTHGGFHSHGGTPSSLAGLFRGKCQSKIRMIYNRGTHILGHLHMKPSATINRRRGLWNKSSQAGKIAISETTSTAASWNPATSSTLPRGWDWCPWIWGFVSHHQNKQISVGDEIFPNISLGDVNHWDIETDPCMIYIYTYPAFGVPPFIEAPHELGHRNQPLLQRLFSCEVSSTQGLYSTWSWVPWSRIDAQGYFLDFFMEIYSGYKKGGFSYG